VQKPFLVLETSNKKVALEQYRKLASNLDKGERTFAPIRNELSTFREIKSVGIFMYPLGYKTTYRILAFGKNCVVDGRVVR